MGRGGTTRRCGPVGGRIVLNCGSLLVFGGDEKWMGEWRERSFWMIRGSSFRSRLRSMGSSSGGKSSLTKWGGGGR